jgi:hypothetical protein
MATIEVDLVFFLIIAFVGLFSLPFIIGWTFWKSYKNPEFWLRLKRQDWVYALVLNAVGKLVTVAVSLKNIGEKGDFTMFKNRTYYWPLAINTKGKPGGRKIDSAGKPVENKPGEEKEGQLIFPYKKKVGAFYRYADPFAQVWAPGNTIFSITDPGMVDDINEMKALQMMMNADSMTKLMRFALILSVVSVLAIGGLAFTVFNQGASVNHLVCVLQAQGNDTIARGCH